jgi:hydroxymethylpyrimidine/phosphomethylpyrimidine kinase
MNSERQNMIKTPPRIPNVLTIAGVDPSGGAGVLADLKTFSALGAYGMGVVAALTAQNTTGVTGVHAVPADFVARQIDTLFADVRIDAVKLGMLGTAEITRAVAARLRRHGVARLVVDPVMVAKSGHHLLAADAVAALRDEVLPLAEVLTPNLPEAEVLLGGGAIRDTARMRDAARRLRALGPRVVLVKGGHLPGAECVDVIDDGDGQIELRAPRIATENTHGTGCTLSAAIAALLPRRAGVREAIRDAKDYLTRALAAADELSVGRGHGPVQHFWRQWKADDRRPAG